MNPQFQRYIGIDYSGAQAAESGLPGLRVYIANRSELPVEVTVSSSVHKHWTRRALAEWLCGELAKDIPTLAGIDHGFSFPLAYFEKYHLSRDWASFLDDFVQCWPTDAPATYVDFVREGICGSGANRQGDPRWLRLSEQWTATAKSVFLFDIQGSVAKSTHAGIPWLRYLRKECPRPIHFWPFDGWTIQNNTSVIAEVYPSLWTRRFPAEGRDADRQAAYAATAWLQRADQNGSLPLFFNPPLTVQERNVASIEGWILGVL